MKSAKYETSKKKSSNKLVLLMFLFLGVFLAACDSLNQTTNGTNNGSGNVITGNIVDDDNDTDDWDDNWDDNGTDDDNGIIVNNGSNGSQNDTQNGTGIQYEYVDANGEGVDFSNDTSSTVDNEYFTLTPGNKYTYSGERANGDNIRLEIFVTDETETINGVETAVVFEELFIDGDLQLNTTHYFAQDNANNVWLFGERYVEFDADGEERESTLTNMSWQAGLDFSDPYIYLPMNINETLSLGNALQDTRVESVDEEVSVPYDDYSDCIMVSLDKRAPQVDITKYYCADDLNFLTLIVEDGATMDDDSTDTNDEENEENRIELVRVQESIIGANASNDNDNNTNTDDNNTTNTTNGQ